MILEMLGDSHEYVSNRLKLKIELYKQMFTARKNSFCFIFIQRSFPYFKRRQTFKNIIY